MARYLNSGLYFPKVNYQDKAITVVLAAEGLEDMLAHFLLGHKSWAWDRRTCSMTRIGREVRYQTDYLLGIDQRLFRYVSIWYPQTTWIIT